MDHIQFSPSERIALISRHASASLEDLERFKFTFMTKMFNRSHLYTIIQQLEDTGIDFRLYQGGVYIFKFESKEDKNLAVLTVLNEYSQEYSGE